MNQYQLNHLINECKQQNPRAQKTVYHYFFPKMRSRLRMYLQDEQDISSIINDGFLKAFKNLDQFSNSKGDFENWLTTIIKRTAFDVIQKKATGSYAKSNLHVFGDTIVQTACHLPDVEAIKAQIANLPSTTKNVLSLSIDGFTHREISLRLRISENASRWHLSEARKKIRYRLGMLT